MSDLLIKKLDQQASATASAAAASGMATARALGARDAADGGASSRGSSTNGGMDGAAGAVVAAAQERQQQSQPLLRLPQAFMLGFFGQKATGLRDAAMSVLHSVAAAAETTRNTLFNTVALVAMSPRVQDEIFAEQQRVIAEYGAELSYTAVSNMPYLEAVVKEAMRLLPAAASGMRRLTEPLTIGDVTLPTGALILSYSNLMHCIDPVLWDGNTAVDVPPHMDWRNNFEGAFRPERWLSEETRPKYYYTFGVGKHMCAGVHLVYLEVKTMLALLLRRHRLRLHTPDMLGRADKLITLKPAPGTDTVLLEPR
ncbi:hypothetical protein HYH02_010362 [Chlamydomonas schloesseri]|uniref:Cytochrome P450 n=1 Tax=Chlamydomonas schloesseri TaxID=2026947 RepID=A0A835T868_9CHLO|nr:hypothetical protein HYH02_010362 [Chlamydomonas schloesseri]|eukprot:KAG2440483.1 hypothetical protein HYH02_010362 [Chlamydomonas schloesseri]